MSNYIITDTQLTSIADAIRAKTGGSATLEFPADFISEIGSISGGGAVLIGTSAPVSEQGDNGNIYIQYSQTEGVALPSGYTELAYIESTGTQFIDTGILASTSDLIMQSEIMLTGIATTSTASGDVIWGGSWSSSGYLLCRYGASPGRLKWFTGGTSVNTAAVLYEWLAIETTKTSLSVDGVSYSLSPSSSDESHNVYLFHRGYSLVSSNGAAAILRMKRTKMYDGATLLRDFVPCKNSSNVVGMYDLVSSAFFTNDGTGSFLSGGVNNEIMTAYLKVGGAWQNLIGSDISDVTT